MRTKNYYLSIILLFVVSSLFSQTEVSTYAPWPEDKNLLTQDKFKVGGDTIWSTTFDWADESDERGWSLPADWTIVDNTDYGFPWLWMKDSLTIGNVTQRTPSFFYSNNDGCINIPAQAYARLEGFWQPLPADTYIQTPKIDCSSAPGVYVSLNQYWRVCCSGFELIMGVTNDDGVHWAYYDMMYGTGANTYTPPKSRRVEINISDVAAGQSNVQIRFWFRGAWDYFWMIDDLALLEAYNYDLVLEDTWMDMEGGFDTPVGHLNYLPKSQIGMESQNEGAIGDYSLKGAVINFGLMDAEDATLNTRILKNGEEIYNEDSESTVLWLLDRDTLVTPSIFSPEDYGDYEVQFEALQPGDERPENNTESMRITVNDTLYLRSDMTAESSANSAGYVGGNNAGDMVGVVYDIYQTTEVTGITAYISGYSITANPTMQFVLLKYIPEDEINIEWLVSDFIAVDSNNVRKWVTLPLDKDGETEFLEPGRYIACVRSWGDREGDEDGIPGIWVGWDLTTKSIDAYTYNYQAATGNEFPTRRLQNIGMCLNETGGPVEAPITFNVNMNYHISSGEFTPGSDNVDIAGTFNNWGGSESLTDDDGDGIYSITVQGNPIGDPVEFKYRINANWDTSEFPDGGPNRRHIVRYWNNLEHVYNSGLTLGINDWRLDVSSTVFPNPNNGNFSVELISTIQQSYEISVTNNLGQVVYSKLIPDCNIHTEFFNLDVQAGIYYLIVQNELGKKIHKLIVN